MTLEPTFVLTPRSSYFHSSVNDWATLDIHGVTLQFKKNNNDPASFDMQHAQDEVFFYSGSAVVPSVDYASYANRRWTPRVELKCGLSAFGTEKELALVFGFNAIVQSRLQIFSDSEQLGDVGLWPGDNQFLMVIERPANGVYLYFIHVLNPGSFLGGNWFFRGVTGYIV